MWSNAPVVLSWWNRRDGNGTGREGSVPGIPACACVASFRVSADRAGAFEHRHGVPTHAPDRLAQPVQESRSTATSQRVMRVFVSSTFRDMHEEREELGKHVLP